MSASPRAARTDVGLIYLTGLVQGLALVTFSAASSLFTSPRGYGFSSTRYGALFLPQVLLAILASGLAPTFANRWQLNRVLVLGVLADLVAMSLLALSNLLMAPRMLHLDCSWLRPELWDSSSVPPSWC